MLICSIFPTATEFSGSLNVNPGDNEYLVEDQTGFLLDGWVGGDCLG